MVGIEAIAVEFCGRGGKRLRPRLCKAAFVAAGGTKSAAGRIADLCEAVECFHKASLIHDDIQDGDEERYGRPTVWKEHGVALAIAVGDWLVAHGYSLIINSGFQNALDMMKATIASHVVLCEGQGDDLLNPQPSTLNPLGQRASHPLETASLGQRASSHPLETTSSLGQRASPHLLETASLGQRASRPLPSPSFQHYLSICERKTGEAFALAAELGALAAGADGAPYRRYGLDFGILFQVRDDLADGDAPENAAALADELARKLEATAVAQSLGSWYCLP